MNKYFPASYTDITLRWRQLGWVPPSLLQEYQDKWKYYKGKIK